MPRIMSVRSAGERAVVEIRSSRACPEVAVALANAASAT
jgi:hypothetical protein